MPLKIFVDSDVVISSLFSSKGAAFLLIQQFEDIKLFISNLSQKELEIVSTRLDISQGELKSLVEKRFNIVELRLTGDQAREKYKDYVSDIHDAHIVLGAKEAKVRFLITYNIKDYKLEKI